MNEQEPGGREDQTDQEKKVIGTVRYNEEEFDQESAEETVSLFVTARSKNKQELENEKRQKLEEANRVQSLINQTNKASGPKKHKNLKPLLLVILIPLGIVFFYFLYNIFVGVVDDVNRKVDIIENGTPTEQSSEIAADPTDMEVPVSKEIVLDKKLVDEKSGMTFKYPSNWEFTQLDKGIYLLNPETQCVITITGEYADLKGKVLAKDLVSLIMTNQIGYLKKNIGIVFDYTAKVRVNVDDVLKSCDFLLENEDKLVTKNHMDILYTNGYTVSGMVSGEDYVYEQARLVYQMILDNADLPAAK